MCTRSFARLMTRKSCAVGMRNAILIRMLNRKIGEKNYIAYVLFKYDLKYFVWIQSWVNNGWYKIDLHLHCEKSLFRLVRPAWRERNRWAGQTAGSEKPPFARVSFPRFYATIFSCGFLSCHTRRTGTPVTRSAEPVDLAGYDVVSLLRRNDVVKHGVAFSF